LNADLEVRGVNLRTNLCNEFQTSGTIPINYLFSAIDGYTTCGYLQEHDVILDLPPSGPVATVSVIIDLNKCKDDKEVLTVLAHQNISRLQLFNDW
jgi:hypothetical protein